MFDESYLFCAELTDDQYLLQDHNILIKNTFTMLTFIKPLPITTTSGSTFITLILSSFI